MSVKKSILSASAMALALTTAVGGTLAFYTSQKSTPNLTELDGDVKIELNEKFKQGVTLIPGEKIEKIPTITNVGDLDTYVFMTFSVPAALDNYVQGTEVGSDKNTIHWNPMGATLESAGKTVYVTEDRVNKAIDAGYLPADVTADMILANNWTWEVFNSIAEGKNCYQETINGMLYNTYILLYNDALQSGETTLPSVYQIFLDATVDMDENGNLVKVKNGKTSAPIWNVDKDGDPIIYVNAYGIQADTFASVDEAFAAYVKQWDTNTTDSILLNAKYPANSVAAAATDLENALATGGVVKLTGDVALTSDITTISEPSVINLNGNSITATRTDSTGAKSAVLNFEADSTLVGDGVVENTIDYCINIGSYDDEAKTPTATADVVINGGTYKGVVTAVNVAAGNLTITGGTFEVGDSEYGATYLINCKDASLRGGTASVTITGGSFKNWNPAESASENPLADFVPDGYTVEKSEADANGDVWYTVVAE